MIVGVGAVMGVVTPCLAELAGGGKMFRDGDEPAGWQDV